METVKRSQWLPGKGVEIVRWIGRKDSEGSENTLYDTAMMDTCHYTFVKTHRMYNTKSEP